MGERGQITRLLAPKYGGFLTFGALSPDRASGARLGRCDLVQCSGRWVQVITMTAGADIRDAAKDCSVHDRCHCLGHCPSGVQEVWLGLWPFSLYQSLLSLSTTFPTCPARSGPTPFCLLVADASCPHAHRPSWLGCSPRPAHAAAAERHVRAEAAAARHSSAWHRGQPCQPQVRRLPLPACRLHCQRLWWHTRLLERLPPGIWYQLTTLQPPTFCTDV